MNQLLAWVDPIDDMFYCFGVKDKKGKIHKCFEVFTDSVFDTFGGEVLAQLEKCKEPTSISLYLTIKPHKLDKRLCNCKCNCANCRG